MRRVIQLICVLSFAYCAASPAQSVAPAASAPGALSEEDPQKSLVFEAAKLAGEGRHAEAVQQADRAIAGYEARYAGSKQHIHSARTPAETQFYLAEAAKNGIDMKVVGQEYGYAYYIKAYSLIDLSRASEAVAPLGTAVSLSPGNSQFLSEIANFYQNSGKAAEALDAYQLAENAAKKYSPADQKMLEMTRAWRGIGFAYIELGHLDEAEATYRRCLEYDANDAKAIKELAYIRDARASTGNK